MGFWKFSKEGGGGGGGKASGNPGGRAGLNLKKSSAGVIPTDSARGLNV